MNWAERTYVYPDCIENKKRALNLCDDADVALTTTMGAISMMEAEADYVPQVVGGETNQIAGLARGAPPDTSKLPGLYRAGPPQVVACQDRPTRFMAEELALYGCPTFEAALALVIGKELDLRQPLLLTSEMIDRAQEYVRAYRRNVLNLP